MNHFMSFNYGVFIWDGHWKTQDCCMNGSLVVKPRMLHVQPGAEDPTPDLAEMPGALHGAQGMEAVNTLGLMSR